jgi:hypothetical protein
MLLAYMCTKYASMPRVGIWGRMLVEVVEVGLIEMEGP